MLTRTQLESLNPKQLRDMARRYGVQPIGHPEDRESWIKILLFFPRKAIDQLRDGQGLKLPDNNFFNHLTAAHDLLGMPTDSQMALIRASHMDEWLSDNRDNYYQEKLYTLWVAKLQLQQTLKSLNRR